MPLITLKKPLRPPWINDDVMRLIRKKRRLWKRIKSNESAELFDKCKVLRTETNKRIDAGCLSYLHFLSHEKLQNKWSFHSMKSESKRAPETVLYGSYSSSVLTSKVELLNNYVTFDPFLRNHKVTLT